MIKLMNWLYMFEKSDWLKSFMTNIHKRKVKKTKIRELDENKIFQRVVEQKTIYIFINLIKTNIKHYFYLIQPVS